MFIVRGCFCCLLTALLVLSSFFTRSLCGAEPANSYQTPIIPVGLDAYRMWDKWAYLRIGQRTYMTSTYDRLGHNEDADASHFLYQLADDRNVTLDVAGPGVLAFARYNHWHGSPWHYIIDGNDYVVKESSTADPLHPVEKSVFIPEKQFPNPLTWTWSITKGADLMWVPLAFEKSFTMAYGRTFYGTGYYIYHKFLPGAKNLSRPIKSWTMKDIPPADVLELINKSGTDPVRRNEQGKAVAATIDIQPNQTETIASIDQAPSSIRSFKLITDRETAETLAEARLKVYWDGKDIPSVDAPVKLFFGAGSIYNRDNREYLVKAFPVNIRFSGGKVELAMYFPMPFMKGARFELTETTGRPIQGVEMDIWYEPYAGPANWVGNFHATYIDHGEPELGKDLVFLDTTKVEGGGDWCGHFVGTSFIFSDKAVLHTLEGDPRFYFDDSQTPQAQGTGTEEWGGGGDYWGGRNMTLPFAGHPVGCNPKNKKTADKRDLIQSAYRFLLSELFPFGKNARITFEHGTDSRVMEHYQSVTFWYGINQPCLKITDTLNVGDTDDERKHNYVSPTASPVQTLKSRYEWGAHKVPHPKKRRGLIIFPQTTDTGRYMAGTSTFTLKLNPENLGVMIRRKFDYAFPNQCAQVYVADDKPGADWREVGTWYDAGSHMVIHSYPRAEGELGKAQHEVQVSNRRWRESEFLLGAELTRGRSSIRVKIEFTPKNIPLYPGYPMTQQAWSEYRYTAYCYVMPRVM